MDEGGKLAALDAEIMQLTKARDELSKKMKAGNKLTAEEAKEYERINTPGKSRRKTNNFRPNTVKTSTTWPRALKRSYVVVIPVLKT